MYKEHRIEKMYYTIGEAVDVVNMRLELRGKKQLAPSALRFYETLSPKLRASKVSQNGTRRYRQKDVDHICRFMRAASTGWFTLTGCAAIMAGIIIVTVRKEEEDI